MNNISNSVPQGDCVLTVFYNKRTVSLLRTGERGATLYGKTGNGKISWPENNRGWLKVTHTNCQKININTSALSPASIGSLRDLKIRKGENQVVASIHDIAYEAARSAGCHVIGWMLTKISDGKSISVISQWGDRGIEYKIQ